MLFIVCFIKFNKFYQRKRMIFDLILTFLYNQTDNTFSRQFLPRPYQLPWQPRPMKSHTWIILIIFRRRNYRHLKSFTMLIQSEPQTPFYRIVLNINQISLCKFEVFFLIIYAFLLTWKCQSIWAYEIHFMTNVLLFV